MKKQKPIDLILQKKKKEIEEHKTQLPLSEIKQQLKDIPDPISFQKALGKKQFGLIAEIKRKSPSHGIINPDLDIKRIAQIYNEAKQVHCVSVLTDEPYFGMNLSDFQKVRAVVTKPILRKDFTIDEYQIYESRLYGADAILLIARELSFNQINEFFAIAQELKMDAVIECFDRQDLDKIPANAVIIGINSRDLQADDLTKTKYTDAYTKLQQILPLIPDIEHKLVISESGIKDAEQVYKISKLQSVAAVLVGGALIRSPLKAINQLMSKISG
jgi:indole-3-glycerol phosphate synthase